MDREQGAGEERDEILISISADGRVTKWSIRKGFECTGKILITFTFHWIASLKELCHEIYQIQTVGSATKLSETKLTAKNMNRWYKTQQI